MDLRNYFTSKTIITPPPPIMECVHRINSLQYSPNCTEKASLCDRKCQEKGSHLKADKHLIVEISAFFSFYQSLKKRAEIDIQKYKRKIEDIFNREVAFLQGRKKKYEEELEAELITTIKSSFNSQNISESSILKIENERLDSIRCCEVNQILSNENTWFETNQPKLKFIVEEFQKLCSKGEMQESSQESNHVSKEKEKEKKRGRKRAEEEERDEEKDKEEMRKKIEKDYKIHFEKEAKKISDRLASKQKELEFLTHKHKEELIKKRNEIEAERQIRVTLEEKLKSRQFPQGKESSNVQIEKERRTQTTNPLVQEQTIQQISKKSALDNNLKNSMQSPGCGIGTIKVTPMPTGLTIKSTVMQLPSSTLKDFEASSSNLPKNSVLFEFHPDSIDTTNKKSECKKSGKGVLRTDWSLFSHKQKESSTIKSASNKETVKIENEENSVPKKTYCTKINLDCSSSSDDQKNELAGKKKTVQVKLQQKERKVVDKALVGQQTSPSHLIPVPKLNKEGKGKGHTSEYDILLDFANMEAE